LPYWRSLAAIPFVAFAECAIVHKEQFHIEVKMTRDVKIIVEQHADGFVAYPVGLRGVIVGEGDTRAEAIADVTSAIQFHVETFGITELEMDEPLLGVFVADTQVAV
jgi:predicted RNase H-like HicB family nuclease